MIRCLSLWNLSLNIWSYGSIISNSRLISCYDSTTHDIIWWHAYSTVYSVASINCRCRIISSSSCFCYCSGSCFLYFIGQFLAVNSPLFIITIYDAKVGLECHFPFLPCLFLFLFLPPQLFILAYLLLLLSLLLLFPFHAVLFDECLALPAEIVHVLILQTHIAVAVGTLLCFASAIVYVLIVV